MATRGRARPTKVGTTEEKSARREELLRSAASTFAELGYSQSRIRDVAERAGILNGSLYYHFDSKEAMLEEILQRFFADLAKEYKAAGASVDDAKEGLRTLIRELLANAERNIDVVKILQKDWHYLAERFDFVRDGLRDVERVWVSVIKDGVTRGDFRDDLDPSMVYRSIRSAIFDAAVSGRRRRGESVDALAESYARLFLTGLCAGS